VNSPIRRPASITGPMKAPEQTGPLPPEKAEPLVTLEDVTLRLGERFILEGTSWRILDDQNWAVLGPNGAGKSSLVGAIAGEVPVARGRIVRHFHQTQPWAVGYVSFGLHERTIQRDIKRDESRMFAGDIDRFETLRENLSAFQPDFAAGSDPLQRILEQLDMVHLLDREIRFLSTGEMRKMLIAKALLKSPRLLILDEPFDGLDEDARHRMKSCIAGLTTGATRIILVTHRIDEITSNITHVLCLKAGRIFLKGKAADVLREERLSALYSGGTNGSFRLPPGLAAENLRGAPGQPVVVEMKNVTVGYGQVHVIEDLNWTIRDGENWAVIGPNGVGKSTLLRMITGDNPQAYANEIYVLGYRRGTGESIWEIKKRIGIISSEFQIQYRKRMTVGDVVLSGFFDTIGLYRFATPQQRGQAQEWLERLGVAHLSERRFDRLSDGEKRLILLARAMVKSPALLILDEPCQGLDPANRGIILDLIDQIGRHLPTNLLYVTHQPSEILPCITHILRLEKTGAHTAARGCITLRNPQVLPTGS